MRIVKVSPEYYGKVIQGNKVYRHQGVEMWVMQDNWTVRVQEVRSFLMLSPPAKVDPIMEHVV